MTRSHAKSEPMMIPFEYLPSGSARRVRPGISLCRAT